MAAKSNETILSYIAKLTVILYQMPRYAIVPLYHLTRYQFQSYMDQGIKAQMIIVTTLNIYSDQSLSWHQNTYLCYNMMFAFDVFFHQPPRNNFEFHRHTI